MTLKITYPDIPDWSDPSEEMVYSPALQEFQTLEPRPPHPLPKEPRLKRPL